MYETRSNVYNKLAYFNNLERCNKMEFTVNLITKKNGKIKSIKCDDVYSIHTYSDYLQVCSQSQSIQSIYLWSEVVFFNVEMNNNNFFDDNDKMQDFIALSKEEFLKSYSYISEKEYKNTEKLYEKERGNINGK